ncbi:hypothetical protein [Roseivirga misakiensis]|uniref:Uncharacterized protein n=1 Tax=Roseivirga misakiensis TaxID=1563681 RepID=A0A1E5T326_9BACT|nr:hypothetical protein [Roseivirga misakiensis]OEK05785.1 hypothetical protein BFP71_06605 [Roseivirga misakiensis]
MVGSKLRVIQDYEKLSAELQEQIKLVYPEGYVDHLITFTNAKGEIVSALRFETLEKIYLVRMTKAKAERLVDEDSDFDEDGNLRSNVREQYEEDHSDVDYLSENDNYE